MIPSKYTIASPVLRLLDAAQVFFANLSLKAHKAYLRVWNWTEA